MLREFGFPSCKHIEQTGYKPGFVFALFPGEKRFLLKALFPDHPRRQSAAFQYFKLGLGVLRSLDRFG